MGEGDSPRHTEDVRPWWTRIAAPIPLMAAGSVVACGLGVLAYLVISNTSGDGDGEAVIGTTTPVMTPGEISIEPPPDPLFVETSPIEFPELTFEQTQRARAIAEADPHISSILDGRQYTMTFGAWTTGVLVDTRQYHLIGAGGTIKLAEPIPLWRAEWPARSDRPQYHRWPAEARARHLPYDDEDTQTLDVQNLKEVYFSVDLDREKVVSVNTYSFVEGTKITYPPMPSVSPVPEGEERAREIFDADPTVQSILEGRPLYGPGFFRAFRYGDVSLAYGGVAWDSSDDVEADWVILLDQDLETGEYENETIHFTAEHINSINVTIDLDRGEVIGIHPDTQGE